MYKSLKYSLVILAGLIICACSSDAKKDNSLSTLVFNVSGVDGKLFVQELRDQSWVTIDSAVNYNGSATFGISVDESDYYRLIDSTSNFAIVILEPGTTTTINGDFKDIVNTFDSKDSKANSDYYNFQRKFSQLRVNEDEWVKKYQGFMESSSTQDSANFYVTKLREMHNESDRFVKSYIDSIMPSFAVYGIVNYIRIEKEFDYMFELADRIKKQMPDSKYSRLFVAEIGRMKTYKDEQAAKEANGKAALGRQAPDFTLQDRKGKSVSLSSLKGKYVLIDFWASWCGPCRAESPTMVKLYKRFKNRNFEILGVSLDGNEAAWNGAIEKDGLNWLHVSDLMQWNSPVVGLYGIEGIPATVIVDPEGIIVAKNLRGEELIARLDELLKK